MGCIILVVIYVVDVVVRILIHHGRNRTHAIYTFVVCYAVLIGLSQDFVNIVIRVATSPSHGVRVIFCGVSVRVFRRVDSELLA